VASYWLKKLPGAGFASEEADANTSRHTFFL